MNVKPEKLIWEHEAIPRFGKGREHVTGRDILTVTFKKKMVIYVPK